MFFDMTEVTDSHLTTTFYQVVLEINEVPPQPPHSLSLLFTTELTSFFV